ncbi:MAG: electron transport complex subunit RsxC [Candidatus Omnitrophica bacterium]|nr:electron transport complex subunit RsxC [Candidatus Omnitrophota bacterium]
MRQQRLIIKSFKQGVHPKEHKELVEKSGIKIMPDPQKIVLPLVQHIGAPCEPLVKQGDAVSVGQKIAGTEKFVSAPIHAGISGRVTAIKPLPHPIGIEVNSIVIEKDTENSNSADTTPQSSSFVQTQDKKFDLNTLDQKQIRSAIQEAGIVGLGGAAFPAHVKLSPPEAKPIDTVILNGCECEPYLTADHRTMLEYPDECIQGLKIIMKAVGAAKGYIGIEMNKPDAIKVMREELGSSDDFNISVIGLKVKYPQGAEKMLIKAVLDRDVPAGGLPMDVGAVVSNAGTAVAVTQAVVQGRALTKRVVTVTGSGIKEPANVLVPIGALFREVIDFCGGLTPEAGKVIMGGPMMGLSQWTLNVPVVKATSGILVLNKKEAALDRETACIRCARCVDHCPMNLLPVELGRIVQGEKWDCLAEYNIKDCIECGCCAYICPSKLPLVQLIKLGKLKTKEVMVK